MKQADKNLDERIRKGLQSYRPKAPAVLPVFGKETQSNGSKVLTKKPPVFPWYRPLAAAAALIVLFATLVLLFLPRQQLQEIEILPSPTMVKTEAETNETESLSPALPPVLMEEIGKQPAKPPDPPLIARQIPVPVKKPSQIEMQLTIPGKDIIIVWVQRQDFDLFAQPNGANGI